MNLPSGLQNKEEEIEELLFLQKNLLELSDLSFDAFVQNLENKIVDSDSSSELKFPLHHFLLTKQKMELFLRSICHAIQCRPLNFNLYLKLLQKFSKEIKDQFSSEYLLSRIFKNNFLRYKMYEIGLITYDSILRQSNADKNVFIYFFPEISVHDKRYYRRRLRQSFPLKQEIMSIDPEFHKKMRKIGYRNDDDITISIIKDDIQTFQYLWEHQEIDLKKFIFKKSIYSINNFINEKEPNFLELSAFFGSIQVFKFLWMKKTFPIERISQFAIAGGCFEIIHIIEDQQNLFDYHFISNINASICFSREEIYDYLMNNCNFQTDDSSIEDKNFFNEDSVAFNCFLESIQSFNFAVFIDLLPQMKGLINKTNENNQTPIHIAVECSCCFFLELILKSYSNEININIQDKWEDTALMQASFLGYADIVQLLCSFPGIDVNLGDHYGWNPLLKACSLGHLDAVKILCNQENIDINCKKKDDETPLHVAAFKGYLDVVNYLCLLEGIKINEVNADNKTPLQLAKMQGQHEVEDYLSSLNLG